MNFLLEFIIIKTKPTAESRHNCYDSSWYICTLRWHLVGWDSRSVAVPSFLELVQVSDSTAGLQIWPGYLQISWAARQWTSVWDSLVLLSQRLSLSALQVTSSPLQLFHINDILLNLGEHSHFFSDIPWNTCFDLVNILSECCFDVFWRYWCCYNCRNSAYAKGNFELHKLKW